MKVQVLVSGIAREIQSKGKTHTFSECWVSLPGLPYPVQIDHYGIIDLAPGDYEVPMTFQVQDRRIRVGFNFRQASPITVKQ